MASPKVQIRWDSPSPPLLANGVPVPIVETGQEDRVTRRAMVALCNPIVNASYRFFV